MASRKKVHPGQLDLFADSGATLLLNDARAALIRRDAGAAADLLERLRREEPASRLATGLATLCEMLAAWPLPATSAAAVAATANRLEGAVRAAAEQVLGGDAGAFLRPFWRELAVAAEPLGYATDRPEACAAELHLRAGDDAAALRAVAAIPDWDSLAEPLRWAALARYHLSGIEGCRPPLFRLALLAPERLADTLRELDSRTLLRDWNNFRERCGWLDGTAAMAAWFPAWYFIEHPGTTAGDCASGIPARPATRALNLVLRLREMEPGAAESELLARRKQLRDLAPELFQLYLERRENQWD